jgi:hypothetical protein
MIERIFAADPRGALEAALSELMTETGADAAGLFVARSDPALLWGVGVDQLCLDRVQST